MPKYGLVRVTEDEEEESFLGYADEYKGEPVTDIPLEELADFCDQNAESRNNHEYVGAHRILAALLHRMCGREQATQILQEIAEYGGLDAMGGVGGEADAFEDFGIEDCWEDWKLVEDKEHTD